MLHRGDEEIGLEAADAEARRQRQKPSPVGIGENAVEQMLLDQVNVSVIKAR